MPHTASASLCLCLLRPTEHQRYLTCNPYVDGMGHVRLRPTPLPWADYAVSPEELPMELHVVWLKGADWWSFMLACWACFGLCWFVATEGAMLSA